MGQPYISKYLLRRRFRRQLRLKRRQLIRRQLMVANNGLSMRALFRLHMPKNFLYILNKKGNDLYQNDLVEEAFEDIKDLEVPKNFSILDNPDESFAFIKRIASIFFYQSCKRLFLNYEKCECCDLATQVYLDSILKDYARFILKLQIYNKNYSGIKVDTIAGHNIENDSVRKLVNTVGSAAILINRKKTYADIVPYKLSFFDASKVTDKRRSEQKEIDTTTFIDYIHKSLSRFSKAPKREVDKKLGGLLGEIIINAEEHSILHSRYLIGFFEESNNEAGHYGYLNFVIMNYGKSIYENFKYPELDKPFNVEIQKKMQALSDVYTKKNHWFENTISEESLWTLYSLQEGVSRIPPETRKRGNGTIQFITDFLSLRGDKESGNESMMIIYSGNTRIDFDGTYQLQTVKLNDGTSVNGMTFNKSGSISDKPDAKYVYRVKHFFPGTLIYAKILITDDDLKNE